MGWNPLRPSASNTHSSSLSAPPGAMQAQQEPAPSARSRQLAPSSVNPPNRDSSIAYMGQNYSRATPTAGHSQFAAKGIALGNVAASTGTKLKRAFAGRRKKPEDASSSLDGKGKQREESPDRRPLPPVPGASRPSPKQNPMQLASQVLSNRKPVPTAAPPPPPPKPVVLQTPKKPLSTSTSLAPPAIAHNKLNAHASVMSTSPSIAPAVNYMREEAIRERAMEHPMPPRLLEPNRQAESAILQPEPIVRARTTQEQYEPLQREGPTAILQQHPREPVKWEEEPERRHHQPDEQQMRLANDWQPPIRHEEPLREPEKLTLAETKDAWRKSDSATSHHTVRPQAGKRTSRPVSMAESTLTIRRLSAMVTDAEFATLEEDETGNITMPEPRKSPASSIKAMNRRSLSLNLGSVFYNSNAPPQAPPKTDFQYGSPPPRPPTITRETPTLTKTAANGFIAPSSSAGSSQSTGNNIRGRLAAWTAATNANGTPPERSPHQLPPQHPRRAPMGQGMRQTSTSITSNFGPAAGMAKRAVERMGRAWGAGTTNNSGYSSSSSTGREGSLAPSSYSSRGSGDEPLGRTTSNQSVQALGANAAAYLKGKTRRTPDAPSGSWSVASFSTSSSASEEAPIGPTLGKHIRGPLRSTGGVLFGRDLVSAVRDTAIGARMNGASTKEHVDKPVHARMRCAVPGVDLKELETRKLPAVVVRCAQHLMLWGVQEEGLFRVSGRPSHVTKVRSEFDTGADYDMSECTPGDIDPHAVASVFKAYLRELPEPILTHNLIVYFDAAMASELQTTASEAPVQQLRGMRGPGLPTGPKSGAPMMRKPPSLSTLAMPSFQGMKPPSESLINALRALISRLPAENRDLIRTVAELIQATAKQSKETKMPLSNLLLVFCPSLSMSPPLLRVLCEAEGIWEPRAEVEVPIVDVKRDSVLDICSLDRGPDEEEEDGGDIDDAPLSPGHVLRERQKFESLAQSSTHPKNNKSRRVPAPMDNEKSAKGFAANDLAVVRRPNERDDTSIRDDNSSTSDARSTTSPPPFSSSVESLATPSTSSGQPSYSELPQFHEAFNNMKTIPIVRSGSPEIAEADHTSISGAHSRSRPRPAISGPISEPFPFPSSASAPPTPLSRRISTTLLSFPSLISPSDAPKSPKSPSSPSRMKRPSLHLLFNKKSGSPLPSGANSACLTPSSTSPYLQGRSTSDTSVSTPLSAQFATFPPTSALPPQLDFAIETSPLKLGMGMDVEQEAFRARKAERESNATIMPNRGSMTPSPPLQTNIEGTPIADFYRTPAGSTSDLLASPIAPATHLRAQPGRLGLAQRAKEKKSLYKTSNGSNTSLLSLEDDEEDWAKTVLLAADADGQWRIDDSHKMR